ncbi:MAG: hypothetical protein HXL03_01475 [Candidatus Nanosynbacter sp.]|nr:hypothetical protein [Candidatus Nanosynbacter sp.]
MTPTAISQLEADSEHDSSSGISLAQPFVKPFFIAFAACQTRFEWLDQDSISYLKILEPIESSILSANRCKNSELSRVVALHFTDIDISLAQGKPVYGGSFKRFSSLEPHSIFYPVEFPG